VVNGVGDWMSVEMIAAGCWWICGGVIINLWDRFKRENFINYSKFVFFQQLTPRKSLDAGTSGHHPGCQVPFSHTTKGDYYI